ncbi:hypothetical protein TCAL_02382 [Tigriopus californicus]|uniref:Platelet-derived growth factor (PDGF) family profile domain-containing protein n=1 Tax=Tigriopus californicus TaxID=6832 RepID=A0A553NYE2_TIGCA|nr:uncharacterized protein LOC131886339 [Tigriopus californicus]TRY70451.1 hypothetical protein TCAL_02382 [Tigriopus californicus]|eukprot:TCALIF_02382-PA protein Name:"Protein of unknown function" AED:0.13 eAED:0.13 QI:0/-1/0/1/-1/1/1/0/273
MATILLLALVLSSKCLGIPGNLVSWRPEEKIVVKYHELSQCSQSHQESILPSMLKCRTRPTVIELPMPIVDGESGSIIQVIPGHILVERCSGSCNNNPSHTCLPTRVVNKTVEVMAIQATYSSGLWNTVCAVVQVEEHQACSCSCRQTAEFCSRGQFYDASKCQCRCENEWAKSQCLSSGKDWNPNTCSCVCPERTWRACSTGFMFDFQNSCECTRIYNMAWTGLTILIGVFVIACIGLSAIVFHLKRRKDLASRRSSIQHQAIAEAFIQEGT